MMVPSLACRQAYRVCDEGKDRETPEEHHCLFVLFSSHLFIHGGNGSHLSIHDGKGHTSPLLTLHPYILVKYSFTIRKFLRY